MRKKNYMRKKKTNNKDDRYETYYMKPICGRLVLHRRHKHCQVSKKFSLLYFEVVVPIFLDLEMISFLNHNG